MFNYIIHQNCGAAVEYITHTPKKDFGVIHLSYHTTKRLIGNFKSVEMKDRFNSIRRCDDPIVEWQSPLYKYPIGYELNEIPELIQTDKVNQ